jgi:signal transduction histidine kinase
VTSAGPSRDEELVRRAARRIGLQTALVVWAAFVVCAGVLLALVLHAQHAATTSTLRAAVQRADDVDDPPADTWLAVEQPDGQVLVTPGAPAFLPYRLASTASGAARAEDVTTPDGEYRVLTERRDGRLVQAASSLEVEHEERARVIEALLVAGAIAVLLAGALGAVAGRRWVFPLADALARQRAFVADASHELRTPLTRLLTRAQLVERSLTRGDAAKARIESQALVTDGHQLAAVLEDLLTAAEPPDTTDWSLLDLDQVAVDVVATARVEAEASGVRLEYISAERPVPDDPVIVRAPRAALDRALLALVDNAVRHSPASGTVQIIVAADRRRAILSVRDSGTGIPDEEQARVFDRFAHGSAGHEGHPSDRQGGGTRRRFGLGLALVADTLQRLGGDIGFTTGPTGTTMTLRLPRAAGAAVE